MCGWFKRTLLLSLLQVEAREVAALIALIAY
jgi:hypothetical protein